MENVRYKRCSQDACTKDAYRNVQGSKIPMYCKQHAADDMVNVHTKPCSYDTCTRWPSFNVEGKRTGVYRKQHADYGMINALSESCSHDHFTKFKKTSMWRVARRRHNASSMPRTGWWMSAPGVAHMTPARGARGSTSRAAELQCAASIMPRSA